MKKLIVGLEKDWLVFLIGIIGLLLVLFPDQLTKAIPYLLGISLILRSCVSAFVFLRYKDESTKPGRAVLFLVLGMVILFRSADAIGVIGVIWAVVSLHEAAEEIDEAAKNRRFSPFHAVMTVISVGLAIMLLFDPFEHFTTHVRILGLEMITSVFIRRHNMIHS